jgi:hypothetical protein
MVDRQSKATIMKIREHDDEKSKVRYDKKSKYLNQNGEK